MSDTSFISYNSRYNHRYEALSHYIITVVYKVVATFFGCRLFFYFCGNENYWLTPYLLAVAFTTVTPQYFVLQ